MAWLKDMGKVIEYIEKNLTQPIQYDSLARIAGCSVHEFSRMFSFIAGMSVSGYIRRRRLSRAVFDIQNSEDKIIDIALKYCYESPTTFTRAFKEMHGVTPMSARKTKIVLKTDQPLSFTIKSGMEELRMAEIVKCYVQDVPAVRLIGKKYGNKDRVEGGFGHLWDKWTKDRQFDVLKQLSGRLSGLYEDADAYIAYMYYKEGEPFMYFIGMFLPENTHTPDGYDYIDIPASKLGVCWVKGQEPDIYMHGNKCEERLAEEGYILKNNTDDAWCSLERYAFPRNSAPDIDGNVIVDICYYLAERG